MNIIKDQMTLNECSISITGTVEVLRTFPARWSSFLDACLTTSIYSEIRINLKLIVNYYDWTIEIN